MKLLVLSKREGEYAKEPYYYWIEESELDISDRQRFEHGDIIVYPKEIKIIEDITTREYKEYTPSKEEPLSSSIDDDEEF